MWVLIPLGIVVLIALALDPIFTRRDRETEPPKHIRRAWLAKRTAREWKGRDV